MVWYGVVWGVARSVLSAVHGDSVSAAVYTHGRCNMMVCLTVCVTVCDCVCGTRVSYCRCLNPASDH